MPYTGNVSWVGTLDPTQFQTLGHGKDIGPTCIPGIFSKTRIGAWYSEEGFPLPHLRRHVA